MPKAQKGKRVRKFWGYVYTWQAAGGPVVQSPALYLRWEVGEVIAVCDWRGQPKPALTILSRERVPAPADPPTPPRPAGGEAPTDGRQKTLPDAKTPGRRA